MSISRTVAVLLHIGHANKHTTCTHLACVHTCSMDQGAPAAGQKRPRRPQAGCRHAAVFQLGQRAHGKKPRDRTTAAADAHVQGVSVLCAVQYCCVLLCVERWVCRMHIGGSIIVAHLCIWHVHLSPPSPSPTHPHTHTHQRAYTKVVPFSPGAGLVQWVHHTIPMVDYLVGSDKQSGAARRHAQPGDWDFVRCFNEFRKGTDRLRTCVQQQLVTP